MTLPILVILPVGFIVLLVVRHQVLQREPVVRGDKVDAGGGWARALPFGARVCGPPFGFGGVWVVVELGRAGEGLGEGASPGTVGALDELAGSVAEMAVPFSPSIAKMGEGANLGMGGGEEGGQFRNLLYRFYENLGLLFTQLLRFVDLEYLAIRVIAKKVKSNWVDSNNRGNPEFFKSMLKNSTTVHDVYVAAFSV